MNFSAVNPLTFNVVLYVFLSHYCTDNQITSYRDGRGKVFVKVSVF